MITRLVRMEFEPGLAESFPAVFEKSAAHIRAFPGCQRVQLMRDEALPHIFYTLSAWDSTEHLNAYRHSPLFKATWAEAKALFGGKPMAFSMVAASEQY
ncbi:MAG: antibiotic biosynthesis monooxygenase [Bacteroidota bacterium]